MTDTILMEQCADRIKKTMIEWLLGGGLGFDKKTDAIGNEVLFSSNRRRADLLILGDHFHALEIKGDLDSLSKLQTQITDYCLVYDKVSVVITPKYKIAKVMEKTPESVGIILVNGKDVVVHRKAKSNSQLDKFELLKFLPKSILNSLLPGKSRLYVDELRDEISKQLNVSKIREAAYQYLQTLYNESFQGFLRNVEKYQFLIDDIILLSNQPTVLNVPLCLRACIVT